MPEELKELIEYYMDEFGMSEDEAEEKAMEKYFEEN